MWPKFEDVQTGLHLAFTGAVKDEIMDVGPGLPPDGLFGERYPAALQAYKLTIPAREEGEETVAYGYRILAAGAGRRKAWHAHLRGEFDTERMARSCWMSSGGKLGSLPWSCRGKIDFLRGSFAAPAFSGL